MRTRSDNAFKCTGEHGNECAEREAFEINGLLFGLTLTMWEGSDVIVSVTINSDLGVIFKRNTVELFMTEPV